MTSYIAPQTNKYQTTVPTLPGYVPRGAGGRPLAQQSDFYRANPYQDNLTPYAGRMEQLGAGYLDQTMKSNPLAGGFNAAVGKWSDAYPDIQNPKTIAGLQAHMSNLSGDRTRMLTDAARQLAGVRAGQRGVAGGMPQEAAAYNSAMNTAAQQYRGDYTQSMEYLRQKALFDQQNRQALADLYKAQLGTGTALTGQAGQALTGAQSGLLQWLSQAGNAYGTDVNAMNQLLVSEPEKAQQMSAAARDQSIQGEREAMARTLTANRGGQPIRPTSGLPDADILQYLEQLGLLGTKTGINAPIQKWKMAA